MIGAKHGIIFVDTVLGIALLAVALSVLLVAITREGRAAQQLADARQAARAAEAVLCQMQAHLPVRPLDNELHVVLNDAPGGGGAVAGNRWVEVTATIRGQTRSVIGLVPADAPTSIPPEGAEQ